VQHAGPVNAVAVTPDGTQIISAGQDAVIKIWDRATQQQVHELTGHSTPILALAVTPDGTQMNSASSGGTVRRWDLATGWEIGEPLAGHKGGIRAVAVTPDGEQIIAGYSDGKLIIWDRATGEQVGEPLTGHTGAVVAVTVTHDGKRVLSAGEDGVILTRDRRSPRVEDGPFEYGAPALAMAISPDGREIATAHANGVIMRWQLDRELTTESVRLAQGCNDIAYTPDGRRIVLAGDDGAVRSLELDTGRLLDDALTGHAGPARAVVVTPDGRQIVSGGDDGAVRVWDLPSGTGVLRGHQEAVHAVAVHGDLIASGGKDGTVRIWDRSTGRPAHRPLTGHSGSVNAVAFTPDGLLVSGCNDHYLRIWEDFAGEPPIEIDTGHTGGIRAIATDVNQIVSAGWDSFIRIWDGATHELSMEIHAGHQGGVRAIVLTPDGTQMISAGFDGGVSIWDRGTGERVHLLRHGTGAVNAVALNPDGKRIISAGADGNVRTWDRSTGELVAENPQSGEVWALAVSSDDGGRMVIGSEDGAVRIWGPGTATLTGHAGPVYAVALAGNQIISGGADGTVRIWDQPVAIRGMRLAEVVSDLESGEDRLNITGDVWTVAAMVAAVSTSPPLSIALLGDWGIGKSSFMRQVRDRVEVLARSDGTAFAANVRQVRFNAWHYSDDHLWVGLVEHLFRELARPAEERAAERITDLEVTLSSRKAERERLDTDLRAVDARRGWLGRLWLPFRSVRVFRAAMVGVWREFRASWWQILLLLGAIGVGSAAVVLGGGWLAGVVAAVVALLGPVVSGWRRLGEFTEQARRELIERKSEVDDEITAVEEKLSRLDPARRLDRLLAEISTAERYESYRGLTGRIHHDLRRLSDDLAAARRHWEDAGAVGAPPLQRIVLYVDDLDRCAPRRVVDVLQAVNLLLTMELFVVVVAVDPRWLLRSLEKHHEGLFDDNAVAYLDKIFHIPVALRPMGEHAEGYLRSLLPPEEESARPALPERKAVPAAEVQTRSEVPQQQQVRQQAGPRQSLPVTSREPEGLRLRAQERDFLARLTPLLGTPRAIKKLVNLYRLLRLGIPENRLGEFIGNEQGAPYQAAALLLATLVGAPHETRHVLQQLATAGPDLDIAEAAVHYPLAEFIVELRKDIPVHGDTETYRQWATTVARYGFETYDLFGG
jgi:WD40 repeat protein